MTFTGCLIILAIIWACINFIRAFIRYKKIRKNFRHTYAEYEAKADIFLKPFFAVIITVAIWACTMLILVVFCQNIPAETEYRTTLTSENQIVNFEEQRDNKCVVSVEGKEYVCSTVVVSNDTTYPQVKFVECKTADNFFAQFFLYEMTGFSSFYELHIPANWFESNWH